MNQTEPTPESHDQREPPRHSTPQLVAANDPRLKSPILAAVLSFMPGLGQVYVGYYQRGFAHILIVASLITALARIRYQTLLIPFIAIFLAFFVLYNIIDAFRRASLYNRALLGGSEIELPDDIHMPGMRGSLAGGVTVMAIGLLLLLNTRFEMSLDWLEDWWPAALILFGGYLVYKAMQDSNSDN